MHPEYGVHKELASLAIALIAAGATQKQVAEACNVSTRTIYTWKKKYDKSA